ncbi:flagellin [Nibricoccus aquaticus]|uniref:Flagellin n=1 Tax=Nibricoccus aquaticus TaxID=2576891 RepID=A0A290Q607_9BACT|nr:flagellin [Nibricoccus aquaticus]ATC64115.1 flagellin [Nibricoccus aquaticus]
MRIATNTASEAVLAQLTKLSQRQSMLQTQAATGQRIFQPEDDPAAVGRILGLETERRQITQFQSNATRALEVSQSSYAGINEMKKISDRAGELVTLGAGASSPDAFKAYAKEVNQLIEQAVQLGNTKFRNDYLFAGTAVTTQPYDDTNRDANGNLLAVTYAGNTSQGTVQLSEYSSIAPGTTSATNTGMGGFINNLIALRDALNTGSSATVSAAQPALETSENLLVNALSEHGAIELRIEVNKKQQETRAQNIETLVSQDADSDLATTVVRLSQTATAYEAALSSATKILQMSLLDYI